MQGLDKDQIWAQLELRAQNVCKMLDYALDGTENPTENGIPSTVDVVEQNSSEEEEEDSDLTYEESDDNSEAEEGSEGSSDEVLLEEGVTGLRDPSVDSDREEKELVGDSRVSSSATLGTKHDHSGLDDGFFNLEDFNAETEEAEAAFVSNGALNADSDDIVSDEDGIDYFASVDGQVHVDDDHGMSIGHAVIVLTRNSDPIRTTLFGLF